MLNVDTQWNPVGLVEAMEENENAPLKCRTYRKANERKITFPRKNIHKKSGYDCKGVTHSVPYLSQGSVDLH